MDYPRKFRFKSSHRSLTCTIKPSRNARESRENIPIAGEKVEFSNHYYETENEAVAERLMYRVRNPRPGSKIEFLGEVYLCPKLGCEDTFEDVVALEDHLESVHGEEIEGENNGESEEGDGDMHACPECGKKFDTPQALNGHMIKHRREAKG